ARPDPTAYSSQRASRKATVPDAAGASTVPSPLMSRSNRPDTGIPGSGSAARTGTRTGTRPGSVVGEPVAGSTGTSSSAGAVTASVVVASGLVSALPGGTGRTSQFLAVAVIAYCS